MAARSLRFRVIVGSLLWMLGFMAIASLAATAVLHPAFGWNFGWRFFMHNLMLIAVAIASIVAGLAQIRLGLTPFLDLRQRLAAVREGREGRITGEYPEEVQPLVTDLNALLDHREAAIKRAMSKAGDLAHGLKTPLAVIAQEAERATSTGRMDAAAVSQQVDRMRRQIDYHLAHARAAASGAKLGARSSVAGAVAALARTMRQLHASRGLEIDIRALADQVVRTEREDLEEMLGNLLDNACKWARRRVVVESTPAASRLAITIDDDGPGIDPALREAVLQRGVRADEAAPGSGLGLAIVRDLSELYGGTIALETSPLGGLRVRLELPA